MVSRAATAEHQKIFEDILQFWDGPVVVLGEDGLVLWSNGATASLADPHERIVAGQPFWSQVPQALTQALKAQFQDCLETGLEREVEYPDRGMAYRVQLKPILLDGDGRGSAVVFSDITEFKRGQDALYKIFREKEHYRKNLEATFRSIPDNVVSVDRDMRVIMTNGPRSGECALTQADNVGRKVVDLKDCKDSPCMRALEQTLSTRRPVRSYQVECRAHGARRIIELNTGPVFDEKAEFSGAVLLVRDVTRLIELERSVAERRPASGMVGKSEPMQRVQSRIEQLAHLDATVLITGESGTGKELTVEGLHRGGARGKRPLIKVNCAALSESILESELFGHVRGAFTGAIQDRVGRIEAAEGGTLFLDEIGDLPAAVQVKLLRFLEQKEFERVGETRTRQADVRVVAATNAELTAKVRGGSFREDLYYRLNVFRIHLPPLRRRREDIPLLVRHFLEFFARKYKKPGIAGLGDEVLAMFLRHAWPGNIRELRHVLEHAFVLCPGGFIALDHLPEDFLVQRETPQDQDPAPSLQSQNGSTDELTRIRAALDKAAGNKSRAAKILGMHRATLYRKMVQFGLPIS